MFSDEFLDSLGEWQNGWSEDQSRRLLLGAKLVDACRHLDDKFKSQGQICYRKRFLHGTELISLFTRQLVEGPASWTTDPAFAKHFKGTVRPDYVFGAIFSKIPSNEDTIVDLNTLWTDDAFLDAFRRYKLNGGAQALALENFGNKQGEVVLHSTLLPEDIYAISGTGSSFDEICKQAGSFDEEQKDKIWEALVEDDTIPGDPVWIPQDRALNIFDKTITQFAAMIDCRKGRSASAPPE